MQVQLCLEICDLEVAHFVEYKPPSITWPLEAQFQITVIKRDRQWFEHALPLLQQTFDEIQKARELARETGELPYPPPPPVARAKRTKRPVRCMIEDFLYGPLPDVKRACKVECAFGDDCAFDSGPCAAVDDCAF